jgi:phosphate starvation-inducible PhoH-like protein
MSFAPRTLTQKAFLTLLNAPSIPVVFASGPAGTGKTLIACTVGAQQLAMGKVQRLIVTRPAVSVDEQHGYLPGTLDEKMDPWTRPVFDSLRRFYTPNDIDRMRRHGVVEVCPLAYMRGRTFEESWIIADEMQNSTPSQMRMVLTRIGEGSKLVVTGDPAQHDRGYDQNGLIDFLTRLGCSSESIKSIQFGEEDIIRHPVIKEILEVYRDQ